MALAGLVLSALAIAQDLPTTTPQIGVYQGKTIEYVESNGMAVVEGDIVLGPVSLVQPFTGASKKPQASIYRPPVSAVWPRTTNGVAEIPYSFSGSGTRTDAIWAIRKFNDTFRGTVQFVDNGGNRRDFVTIAIQSQFAACTGKSQIGRQGNEQFIEITGSQCKGVILHELGHAAGLLHEHSRKDRIKHLSINWQTIPEESRSQYRSVLQAEDWGAFDYSSIMIYNNATTRVIDPQIPAMETIPPGLRLLPMAEEYSAADIAAMRRLYGPDRDTEPIAVTNPPNFPLKIDRGFSQTTLDVPRNGKNDPVYRDPDGALWLFARWSDIVDPARQSDARRVVPNGSEIYIANFVKLARLANNGYFSKYVVQPPGSGTITVLDTPITIEDVRYRVVDAPVTIRATPAAGYQFYGWSTLSSDTGTNVKRVSPDTFTRPEAWFARRITARIETEPPGLLVTVDQKTFRGAKNFAASEGGMTFDGTSWSPNSTHTLRVAPQQPSQVEDPEAILRFHSWSDSVFETNPRQFRANGQTIVARYVHAYPVRAVGNTEPEGCAIRNLVTNPPAEKGFYNEGTQITARLDLLPGWRFLGWEPLSDRSSQAPQTIAVEGTTRLKAVLNTNPEPLTLRRLEPEQMRVGTNNLELLGSGFDSTTRYCIYANGVDEPSCDAPSETSPTRLAISLPSALTSRPGRMQIEVRNGMSAACQVRSAPITLEVR